VNLDQSVSNNGWNLTVIGASSLEIKLSHTIYYLKSENDVTLESGSLESINGTSSGFNITYFDKDGNGKISCYDVIFISNVGGSSNTAHKGYKFSLYYMDKYLMVELILK
ncbi:MAG: hypothetical protein QME47_06560, partial [Candidatus Thermoplasmatota archaeon]|nr:hypothetical protein [Candidatus Thermoplasmatota archaeon]